MQELKIKLPKVVDKSKKRLGRGRGSGKGGHTVGRGQKGQKARTNIPVLFEGMKVKKSLIKKLPFQRGKGKFKSKIKPFVVGLDQLNSLSTNSNVDLDFLIKEKIVKEGAGKFGVKILRQGKLSKKLTINLPISKKAAQEVEKLGGKVINLKK